MIKLSHFSGVNFSLKKIYINGGKRGFIIEINPKDLRIAFQIIEVDAAIISH